MKKLVLILLVVLISCAIAKVSRSKKSRKTNPKNQYYSYNGKGNHPKNPEWGAVGMKIARLFGYHYADANSGAVYTNRPDVCDLMGQLGRPQGSNPEPMNVNALWVSFGQFSTTHDIGLVSDAVNPELVPTKCFPMARKAFIPNTNPREHANAVTSYLDLHVVYGENEEKAHKLRTHKNGLLIEENGIPPTFCKGRGIELENPLGKDLNVQFCVGDIRGNNNVMLLVFHVLFLREHNRIARSLKKKHPTWSDEKLYQKARAINIAQYQNIVWNEFIKELLPNAWPRLKKYKGFKPNVVPSLYAEFDQGAYRLLHAQVPDVVVRTENGVDRVIAQSEAGFVPGFIRAYGIGGFLEGMAKLGAPRDPTTFPVPFNQFLAGIDIFRSRDFGLVDYKTAREKISGVEITSVTNITSDTTRQTFLTNNYGNDINANNIDLLVGCLFEDPVCNNCKYGPVSSYIFEKQLVQIRDGDFKWFENPKYKGLTPKEKARARKTKLSDIILRNTNVKCIQEYALLTPRYSKMVCKK